MNPESATERPVVASGPASRPGPWAPLASSLAVACGFAVTAALMMSPFFATPFVVLLARTLFIAMALLLAFSWLQRRPDAALPWGLPRWMLTTVTVTLTALAATFIVYLVAVDGRLSTLMQSPPRVTGLLLTGLTALVLGLTITLSAQLREREARERSQALAFELERSRLEKQAVDARLALLQAQIEPHFLFNTLANVQALVEAGSPRAPALLQSLIDYLRAAMPRLHAREPQLADELALVRAYLELMQMRMPDRLSFSIDVDATLATRPFPPMALLTLVENAVRHGLDPAEDGGTVDIGAALEPGGSLRLWVADTGVGMAADARPGTGLSNLRERLAVAHGHAARLELSAQAPRGLRAEIVLPSAQDERFKTC
jgi:sensor histidine kinase YesM